ncbi:MAG TPA: helix-hairpin-helix domain-containing protein [Bryobacteraceae bacterium]|nr:helix-hairpin-helix domain-containing protein [Bryobacteraceae bacterium]
MKSLFLGTLLSLLVISVVAARGLELPDGKGKDLVESTCSDCHSLDRIMAQRLDEDGWHGIIRQMIENGAAINPNDLKGIVDYLAKNFGPDKKVNINKAGRDEIGAVLKLAPAEATAIVQYRTQHGNFKDLSELEKVSGLADKIEAKKALIEF